MKNATLLCLWAFLLSASASQLPFLETFEASDGVAIGSVNGQNGWVVGSGTANVQSGVVQDGTQALQIQNGQVSHDLSSDGSALWLHFQARCMQAPDANPTVTAANTSLAFFVNTNLNLVVYSNTVPVELSAQIQTNVWTRFDVYCDYDDLHWDLSMDGVNVAAGLPLYSTNRVVGSLLIGNENADPVYVDQIDVADTEQALGAPDSDGDGIPDWWEQKHFGSVTGAITNAPSGNNGLTYLQTYIAGVSPTAFDPFVVVPVPAGNGLQWSPVPSRLYSVYWTPSLTNAFAWLQDFSYPQSEFIDTVNNGEPAGFYRLQVQVQ